MFQNSQDCRLPPQVSLPSALTPLVARESTKADAPNSILDSLRSPRPSRPTTTGRELVRLSPDDVFHRRFVRRVHDNTIFRPPATQDNEQGVARDDE